MNLLYKPSMNRLGPRCLAVAAVSAFFSLQPALFAEESEQGFEDFNPANFAQSTSIDNQWFPLKPGTRYMWEGTALNGEDVLALRVVFAVTDLTKVISGVRTVVSWSQKYADGELVESGICFFAQDNDGTVWLMGEYPEVYDDAEFLEAPCWMHGVAEARAGVIMPGTPQLGDSYSQGWAPSVDFSDRAVVYKVDQKTTVHAGRYENVLVIDEYSPAEPNAHQLKYYAPGVGNVRVGWRGDPTDQESLELVKFEQITAGEMAKAREAARALEQNAYLESDEVYGATQPLELPAASAEEK
jgi:hypothetical protein